MPGLMTFKATWRLMGYDRIANRLSEHLAKASFHRDNHIGSPPDIFDAQASAYLAQRWDWLAGQNRFYDPGMEEFPVGL